MRLGLLVCGMLALPTSGRAEWQLKPFLGATLDSSSTLVTLGGATDERRWVIGGGATWLSNFVGVEADIARVPGFFQADQFVLGSSVTMFTGNALLTLPRKVTQYGLRPYVVGGGGVVRVVIDQGEGTILDVRTSLRVVDFGGGATGFLTDRVGLNWDVRYFRSVGGKEGTGLAIGKEQISFWRASMGVAIRLGKGR